MHNALGLALFASFVSACAGAPGFVGKEAGRTTTTASPKAPAEGPAPKGADATAETADVPVWVNGSYLTCSWLAVAVSGAVSVQCSAYVPDQKAVTSVHWRVFAGASEIAAATGADVTLVVPLKQVVEAVVVADVKGAAAAPTQIAARFVDVLPGFEADGKLAACFASSAGASACLASAGVPVGPSERAEPAPVAAPPAPEPAPAPVAAPEPAAPATPAPAPTAPAPAPSPAPAYASSNYNGVNYHRGDANESCTEVCASLGGTRPETIALIGSGGDINECSALVLTFDDVFVVGSDTGFAGVGCSFDAEGVAHHVVSPATTQAAKAVGVRRLCACVN